MTPWLVSTDAKNGNGDPDDGAAARIDNANDSSSGK
jgi:hypothetical protein